MNPLLSERIVASLSTTLGCHREESGEPDTFSSKCVRMLPKTRGRRRPGRPRSSRATTPAPQIFPARKRTLNFLHRLRIRQPTRANFVKQNVRKTRFRLNANKNTDTKTQFKCPVAQAAS